MKALDLISIIVDSYALRLARYDKEILDTGLKPSVDANGRLHAPHDNFVTE